MAEVPDLENPEPDGNSPETQPSEATDGKVARRLRRRGDGASHLSQMERVFTLGIYIVALYLSHGFITGSFLEPLVFSGSELWLVAALGYLAYSLLDAPFFVPPSQALAGGLTSALLLLAIDVGSASPLEFQLEAIRWAGVLLAVVVGTAAVVAIVLHRRTETTPEVQRKRKAAYEISQALGDGRALFTPPALISIVGFHNDSSSEILWLTAVWMVLVLVQPVQLAILTFRRVQQWREEATAGDPVGWIHRIDSPGIVRVEMDAPDGWKRNAPHIACLADSKQVQVIPIASQPQEDGYLGTGLICGEAKPGLVRATAGYVYRPVEKADISTLLGKLSGSEEASNLVGFVVEDSRISGIRFEVTAEIEIQEGMLVFCRQANARVFYQILDALTHEESFERNPFGSHRAFAVQLGVLDAEKGFLKHPWLPRMNCPVFLADASEVPETTVSDDEIVLGNVPGTNVPVRARFSDILSFHTAVLGVTGTGKTEFVFDIIRHGIDADTKIFCVDLTEEYRSRLADLEPQILGFEDSQMRALDELLLGVETGEYGASDEKRQLAEWLRDTRPTTEQAVAEFLESTDTTLGIFELPEIANTKATLRATELYLSAIFNWARRNRLRRRILLVLEEAHTVIPETALFGHDRAETNAVVGRMGQIALQGRKYGVGLLLISQRTALVSKTLLSQCNTCFSFAMYDKTGLEYMKTVYGEEHVQAIPNLGFLEGVAFGKAVMSERPVLFEIPFNEAKKQASEALAAAAAEETEGREEGENGSDDWDDDSDDDIPF